MTAGVIDEYPRLLRSKQVMITAVLCIIQFLLGIPFCMQVILYCLIASQQKRKKNTYIRRDYRATIVMQKLQYRHKNIVNQNAINDKLYHIMYWIVNLETRLSYKIDT
jgi:hypothetical protein